MCIADLPLGSVCGRNEICLGDQCVDGVCCDGLCDGTCESCAVVGSLGACSPMPVDTDPDDECPLGCDGLGACQLPPDAGMPDAGPSDAGSDGGSDAGMPDAGPADAGPADAGTDAAMDAGADAAADAGPDAAPDAGTDAAGGDASGGGVSGGSGCSCRVGTSAPRTGWLAVMLVLGAFVRRRRRA